MSLDKRILKEIILWQQSFIPGIQLQERYINIEPGGNYVFVGLRRAGKTYMLYQHIRQLLRQGHDIREILFINFEDERITDMRKEDLHLVIDAYRELFAYEPIIFLDEIQHCPNARTALKFLAHDNRFDVIASGSLLGINYAEVPSFPVGYTETIKMFPLDFEEFLWARADTFTMPLMREHFVSKKPMGALHQEVMRSFREYMLVGGMPQVVQAFINDKDYGAADSEKQRILSFWQDGMREQSKENCDYLQAFFAHIPSELMRRNKRYVISHATPNARW